MLPGSIRKIAAPFDDYEIRLLELIWKSEFDAYESAKRAQDAQSTEIIALRAYVEHMEALARTRSYNNALWEYRRIKLEQAVGASEHFLNQKRHVE